MKNLSYFFALFFAIVFISSCGECQKCANMDDNGYTVTLKDTISETRYNTWVTNWKNHGQTYIADTLTEYFTMPIIDLTEFLQFPGSGMRDSVVASRFVLGMEINGTDIMPHLMLVGVNAAGQSLTDESKQQFVYDVTRPCPSMCGINSLPK